jgi:hypothetical protein
MPGFVKDSLGPGVRSQSRWFNLRKQWLPKAPIPVECGDREPSHQDGERLAIRQKVSEASEEYSV